VLLTSRTEGLPAVLIEAGLRGLPVVATEVGYVAEIVVHGQTGLLVEPGNRTELVSAIGRAMREGAQLGGCARSRCLTRFNIDRVADGWDLLLSGLRSASGSPQRQGSSVPPTLTAAGAAKTTLAPRAGSKEQ